MSSNVTTSDNKTMPIDQYGRYNVVASVIKQLMAKKNQTKVKILDLGGYKGEIYRFFNKNEAAITILDIYDVDDKNYVKGSAMDLPFDDNSFDYVVSFEVFEHIERKDRELFIKEGARVSRGAFLLTAPFAGDHDEVFKSEVHINDLWQKIHKQNHQWLHEHIMYKTPKTTEIESILNKQALLFKKIGNNDLILWNLMLSFSSYKTLFEPTGRDIDIQFFYNDNYEILDSNTDHFYRYIYIIGPDTESVELAKNTDVPIERKVETVTKLISLLFMKMSSDVLKDRVWRQKRIEKVVIERDHQIHLMRDRADIHQKELESIISSKSWGYARKIANIKDIIVKNK